MKIRALQICGTGSGVGKSVIVTALCRIFLQDGYRVCPFKAQNMSLNSFVTSGGAEIGRAQATQALSCRILPHADMNPVLLKPMTNVGSQVIVQGKPIGNRTARQYQQKKYKKQLFLKVKESFNRLKKEYELVVIEGAGSPAEINLKSHDIVNLKMAAYAQAPVILLADIDQGGVFASLVGTLQLLDKKERRMVKGFIINKFRGDKSLLRDGLRFLERKTKKPVLGVIPYFKDITLPEEDSAVLDGRGKKPQQNDQVKRAIKISVIKLPHISNFTDFDAFKKEPDISLDYIDQACHFNNPDLIIIPGTKNTIQDLIWLKNSGLAGKIIAALDRKEPAVVAGICGGYQMLGERIYDAYAIESSKKKISGLGIFPTVTFLEKKKVLTQVKAREVSSGLEVSGYEIHHGRSCNLNGYRPAFKIIERAGKETEIFDGIVGGKENILGTYIHGVFDADNFRRDFLNRIRIKKGLAALNNLKPANLESEFDQLADLVRRNINLRLLYKILNAGI